MVPIKKMNKNEVLWRVRTQSITEENLAAAALKLYVSEVFSVRIWSEMNSKDLENAYLCVCE